MNKLLLLPKLSIMGIRRNGASYFPYILAGSFSVFVFFVFSSILANDIMLTLPRSSYALLLMRVGQVLLGLILLPFIVYTNSFLIKRRKKELGLYSILGLDKKHMAVMMLWESIIIFGAVMILGIVFGLAFSKLMFLLLLNLSSLPVSASFGFSSVAFYQTFLYFLAAYGINLVMNIIRVFRTNPNDLLKSPKKGDREPKHLWLTALSGLALLGVGYNIAITSKLDSSIFLNFLLAVSLVIIGTHQFFKAGLLAFLKVLKRNRRIYYSKSNFVTISGMLHRMKKSASSLSNICIFSTMTIITLLCTLSVWLGSDGMQDFQFPYDATVNLNAAGFRNRDGLNEKLLELADSANVKITDRIEYTLQKLRTTRKENVFTVQDPESHYYDRETIRLILLDEYNAMENTNATLGDNEILIYSTGADLGFDHVILGTETYYVRKELDSAAFARKAANNTYGREIYMVVSSIDVMDKLRTAFGSTADNDRMLTISFNLEGQENDKDSYAKSVRAWCEPQPGYISVINGTGGRRDTRTMNGGLLFIGIFFSIIFAMCLILIMYYKQITEGYDDRNNFDIMQKVGMSDEEVRGTIRKQILMVFYSPLVIALLHTMAGFNMTAGMLNALQLFDTGLIIRCGLVVAGLFTLLYGFSYSFTSRTYYGIVKQMDVNGTAKHQVT
jgi:putative ABC transport system permease protein